MKLAIIGSRNFTDYKVAVDKLSVFIDFGKVKQIISGGARGADAIAKSIASNFNIDYLEFPAKWDLYGKQAGMIRNKSIIDACDYVAAFWDGKSTGTANSLSLAKKQKKSTIVIYF